MPDTLLQFPCSVPVKVMGLAGDEFIIAVLAIVRRHCPDFSDTALSERCSSGGRYLALTCEVQAKSREQMDALYRELSACDRVLMAL
jgi:hypothetical protein